jgi:hypothetical protein
MNQTTASFTLPLGGILAAVLSWKLNHSIGWAIVHFIFNGFYIAYAIIFVM